MGFAYYLYDISVVDQSNLDGFSPAGAVTTGILTRVFDAGTKTHSTIYTDGTGATALTVPISRSQFATDGKIKFYSASTSHDLAIYHSDGSFAIISGVTPNTHTIKINRTGNAKVLVFPMAFNAGGTETDTGLDLPLGACVKDVLLEVTTLDATETVDIGLLSSESSGDADGFLVAASVATAGFVKPFAYTQGTYYYVSSTKYGALFGLGQVGDNNAGSSYGVVKQGYHIVVSGNAVSVSYTPSTSDTFVGLGYLFFDLIQ